VRKVGKPSVSSSCTEIIEIAENAQRSRDAMAPRAFLWVALAAVLVATVAAAAAAPARRVRPEVSGAVAARRRPENDGGKTCNVFDFGAAGDTGKVQSAKCGRRGRAKGWQRPEKASEGRGAPSQSG
jgi:hypothetical protein